MRKQLPDGTWYVRVNPAEQTPEENLTDMIAGFFSGSFINKENVRKVIVDVIEFIDNNQDKYCNGGVDSSVALKKNESDDEVEEYDFQLSICFVYQRIADAIVRHLGDLEFARQLFKQSESLANCSADYSCLAGSVLEYMKDAEWFTSLKNKAHSNVKCYSDILAIYCDSSDN